MAQQANVIFNDPRMVAGTLVTNNLRPPNSPAGTVVQRECIYGYRIVNDQGNDTTRSYW